MLRRILPHQSPPLRGRCPEGTEGGRARSAQHKCFRPPSALASLTHLPFKGGDWKTANPSFKLFAAALWITVVLETSFAHAQNNTALAATGAELAKTHCARCHVIDTKNVFGGISSSPSFPLLVNGLKDWEERMQSFHVRPPHPSIVRFKGEAVDPNVADLRVPVIIEYSDIDALVAYVRTLKKGE